MTSCEPHVGDIWLAYVEFADRPGGKVRPALVVSLHDEKDRIIAAKITASANWAESEYIAIPHWEEYGLRKPSYVQLSPLFAIKKSQLLREEPLGRLPQSLWRVAFNAFYAKE